MPASQLTRGFVFLLLLALAVKAPAQYKFEKGIHFTKEDGLPGNSIRDIGKDPNGFVWITTGDGLVRFDGAQFKVYQHDEDRPASLLDNRTCCLAIDSQQIWIGTQIGLSRLDLKTDQFRHYQFDENGARDTIMENKPEQIRSMFRDRQGNIWIGTRNYDTFQYDPVRDTFWRYPMDIHQVVPHFPSPRDINSILGFEQHRENDSIIWAGTLSGLVEINSYTHQARWLPFNLDLPVEKRWGNDFRKMYHHHDGLLYAGAWSGTLLVYDPEKEVVSRLKVSNSSAAKILAAPFHSILGLNRNEIMVTTTQGMVRIDTRRGEATQWKENNEDQFGATMIDEQKRAWLGTYKGLYVFDPMLQQFDSYSFDHLEENQEALVFYMHQMSDDSTLLIAPRGSRTIYHFNKGHKTWEKVPIPAHHTKKNSSFRISGASMSPNGEWTIAYNGGIFLYNPKLKRFRSLPSLPSLREMFLSDLRWDSQQRLWITTFNEGICRFDAKTGQWHVFQEELKAKDPKLLSNTFTDLFEDSHGNIWFQRERGHGIFLSSRDTFIQHVYTLHPDNTFPTVHSFAEDRYGRVWVLGAENWIGFTGVNKPEDSLVRKFNLEEVTQRYLQTVWSIRSDPAGDIWCFSEKLLVKIHVDDFSFSTYSYGYGEDDPVFFALEILPTGELALGGRKRIVLAKTADFQRNQELPIPYLTSINVREESLIDQTSPLYIDRLKLRYRENFFSFEFSAKEYTLGNQVKFRYRLQNFDEKWIDAKSRRYANYTNVPGGNYNFQLQAANNEGIWNETLFELPVEVAIPWWKTWGFITGLSFSLVMLIYGLYRYRIMQIRKEEKLKSAFEKKLANVQMSALRAQMNPHFLFNCLNSIESFIIKNETKKASEYLNNFARLIRLILQNSRSNYVNLKDELEAIDLYLQMESLRFKNKFHYEINIEKELDTSSIDIPPMLIQPYIENAIWHGLMHKRDKKKGRVIFSLHRENGLLHCVIEDNGIGRAKAAEIKKSRIQNSQASVGMKITKDRIEIINTLYKSNTSVQIIDLIDAQQNALGTRVELSIPV